MDKELECMVKISSALSEIEDTAAIKRILSWANQKYLGSAVPNPAQSEFTKQERKNISDDMDLEGIAMLTQNGEVKITARDLHGKNAVDSALRLIHIVIYAHEILKSEKWVSSRKVITPILKDHRLYTGSIRAAIAKHKGIVRDGEFLGLDQVSRSEAEKIVNEIKS